MLTAIICTRSCIFHEFHSQIVKGVPGTGPEGWEQPGHVYQQAGGGSPSSPRIRKRLWSSAAGEDSGRHYS